MVRTHLSHSKLPIKQLPGLALRCTYPCDLYTAGRIYMHHLHPAADRCHIQKTANRNVHSISGHILHPRTTDHSYLHGIPYHILHRHTSAHNHQHYRCLYGKVLLDRRTHTMFTRYMSCHNFHLSKRKNRFYTYFKSRNTLI